MKRLAWKNKIISLCTEAGTYLPVFDPVIDTLASILEKRDLCEEQYKSSGAHPIIAYTNKNGSTNPTKNPALILWDDYNKTALSYWRDLGLTPAGLKRIDSTIINSDAKSSRLLDALQKLSDE